MKNLDKSQGLVDPKGHCYRKIMKGMLDNKDLLV